MPRRAPLLFALALLALTLCAPLAPAHAQNFTYQRPEPAGFTPYLANTAGPFRSEYLAAAQRWPTALSCLTSDQRSSPTPDITQINWIALRSELDAEACLFRILEALVTPAQAQRWFASQRMHNITARKLPRQRLSQIEICASNAPEKTGRVLVQSDQTAGTVSQYLYGGETFCARYSRDGFLLSTSYVIKGQGDYPQDDRIRLPPILKQPKAIARPVYRRRN